MDSAKHLLKPRKYYPTQQNFGHLTKFLFKINQTILKILSPTPNCSTFISFKIICRIFRLIWHDFLDFLFFVAKYIKISSWNFVCIKSHLKANAKKIYNPFWYSWANWWFFFQFFQIKFNEYFSKRINLVCSTSREKIVIHELLGLLLTTFEIFYFSWSRILSYRTKIWYV